MPASVPKKLEPNEIGCSQGLSQNVVSTNCSVFKYGRLLKSEEMINEL